MKAGVTNNQCSSFLVIVVCHVCLHHSWKVGDTMDNTQNVYVDTTQIKMRIMFRCYSSSISWL